MNDIDIEQSMDDVPAGSRPVVVVGAGLAGLAAAATAVRAGTRVLVLDGRSPGGRARTDERNGFRFNQGAHALFFGGHAERVITELGLAMPAGAPPSDDAWGRRGDVVSPLPSTPTRAARSRLVGVAGLAQLGRLARWLRGVDAAAFASMSFESWLTGRGLRDDVAAIVRMVARVSSYGDDLSAISADAVLAQLRLSFRHAVRYVDGGWQVLVDDLVGVATAGGAEMRTGAVVTAIERDGSGLRVALSDGSTVLAGAVVVAVGGPDATSALLPDTSRWQELGPPSTVACLDLGLRRSPDRRVLFGVDEPMYLSSHGPPAQLAPAGHAVVHLMRYGARSADVDRAALWDLARSAGVRDDDVIEQRFMARMVTSHAVPVPGRGLAGRPGVGSTGVPKVYVAGDWVGPDGLLADAALASGAEAGRLAAIDARSRTVPVVGGVRAR